MLLEKYPKLHRPEIGEMAGYCASVITDIALTNSFEEYAMRNERRSSPRQTTPQVTDMLMVVENSSMPVISAPSPGIPLDEVVEMIIVRLDKLIDAQYKLLDAWNRA